MPINRVQTFTALGLALFHLVLVGCIYTINVVSGISYAPMLWVLLAMLDYPVGLGVGIEALQVAGDYEWNNQLMPLLYFGKVGTLWWFLLGNVLVVLVKALKKVFRKGQEQKTAGRGAEADPAVQIGTYAGPPA